MNELFTQVFGSSESYENKKKKIDYRHFIAKGKCLRNILYCFIYIINTDNT